MTVCSAPGGRAARGQPPGYVANHHAAGPDDQHAAALVAPAVGVEQVRRAVQRDHGLAGARATGDRDDTLARRADRLVLLGLDGRDDRVHRPVASARELRHQRALADDRQVGAGALQRLGVEQLVLHADDLRPDAAQHPAAYDGVRLGRGRLVEHRGGRRAPVDQQRVAVGVAQPDPADVARLGVDVGVQVEAAEDQPLVGSVELGDAARRLEDHGVALDQAALVPEVGATVALLGKRLGLPGGGVELDVHPVHERLLGCDLPLDQLFGQLTVSSPERCCGKGGLAGERTDSGKSTSVPRLVDAGGIFTNPPPALGRRSSRSGRVSPSCA